MSVGAVLGLSAYYHDSAAALVEDGEIVCAAQEERFTRRKHDARFPCHAVKWCLEQARGPVDHVVFYEKPLVKFERLLETYSGFAPRGLRSFVTAMPVWLKQKLNLRKLLRDELRTVLGREPPELLFTEHHHSHAASAFYPSPFDRATVLCMDGVGEWATTSVWLGEGPTLTPKWQLDFPHSLGLLYSAFTSYTGFKVNSGEYKLMGLAPYGEPRFVDVIREHLVDIKDDGTFRLDMRYFDFATGLRMTSARFHDLFGGPPRQPEGELSQKEMDLARSIQDVTDDVVLRLGRTIHRETGAQKLCLAGGVALNCVANGRLLREGPFDDLWIQPAAGDAGGALGAALVGWHEHHRQPRVVDCGDRMRGSYLGPAYTQAEVRQALDRLGAVYEECTDLERVAQLLADGAVVGWFQGPMEFGPRALGGRSILGDARNPRMQSQMNLKIKYRESFRPFAPAVLAERAGEYFELDGPSPYMLLTAPVRAELRRPTDASLFGLDRLHQARSTIPAVTHVDHSARIQTVHRETNPRFYHLLRAFADRTGCAVLVNTSFNVRGEPIVCTPEDAYRCFMRTEMDALVIEGCLLAKAQQPARQDDQSWRQEFQLD
jgi:carbamoyltransferase